MYEKICVSKNTTISMCFENSLISSFEYLQNTELTDSWPCLKHNSLLLLDDIRSADVIPLTDSIELIRRPNK